MTPGMKPCVIRARADTEISEHTAHIARDSPQAAKSFLSSIEEALTHIMVWPEWGSLYDADNFPDLRRMTVPGFSWYKIFFKIKDNKIIILRVLHDARDIPRRLGEYPVD